MRRRPHLQRSVLLLLTGCAPAVATNGPEPVHASVLTAPEPEVITERPEPRGWVELPVQDAPQGREDHTAVWTGTEMIVWGGERRRPGIEPLDTGARYDPTTDRWTAMTVDDAPARRDDHAVVWTGTEMIVWGGNQADESSEILASGGRYDPREDRWTPTTPGPLSPRDDPTAVWTGSEMIIWGGCTLGRIHEGSGARYDPALDRWTSVSSIGAPQAREDHTAVWTGTEMIIWGGWSGDDRHRHHFRDGARYDPSSDQWRPLSSKGAPAAREDHTAVWTGTEMLVWGGVVHEYGRAPSGGQSKGQGQGETEAGGRIERAAEDEAAEPDASDHELDHGDHGPPTPDHAPPKANERRLVQLGTGALYDPATDTWRPMSSVGAPTPREDHVAVWMGHELLVWGGRAGKEPLADGAIYDPHTDRWRPMSTRGQEPTARWNHTAVLTNDEVIIWGGFADGYDAGGGRYFP